MSKILLERAKAFLKVTHTDDDEELQELLDAAEDEALRYMDRDYLPVQPYVDLEESEIEENPVSEGETPSETSEEVVPSVRLAVYLLLKAAYDGADAHPVRGALDLDAYRKRAETLLMPYRRHIGV